VPGVKVNPAQKGRLQAIPKYKNKGTAFPKNIFWDYLPVAGRSEIDCFCVFYILLLFL